MQDMRNDYYTSTEADAGRFAAARAEDTPSDYEPEPQRSATPAPLSLDQLMRAAIAHPHATTGFDREVRLTAPGVAAFQLHDGDNVPSMTALLSWTGVETQVVDGILYGRRVETPALDPWAVQDQADKNAARVAVTRRTA